MKLPSMASTTMVARHSAPIMNLAFKYLRRMGAASTRLRRADARIDQEIENVDEDIDDDEQRRIGHHDAGGERNIADRNRLVEEGTEPGPAKYDLDDDAARNQ